MTRILGRLMIVAATMAGCFALAPCAAADDAGKVVVGVLNCQEDGGWGLVVGSSHRVNCFFTDGDQRTEFYSGRISKLGVDIGYKRAGVIIWTVLAPSADVASGALRGDYGGATASAAVGVGAGANVLVGGSLKSITLQPVSFEGLTGVNVAGGVEALTLEPRT